MSLIFENNPLGKAITSSKDAGEFFAYIVEERASILEESGMDEHDAFQEAVKQAIEVFRQKMVEQGG